MSREDERMAVVARALQAAVKDTDELRWLGGWTGVAAKMLAVIDAAMTFDCEHLKPTPTVEVSAGAGAEAAARESFVVAAPRGRGAASEGGKADERAVYQTDLAYVGWDRRRLMVVLELHGLAPAVRVTAQDAHDIGRALNQAALAVEYAQGLPEAQR